MTRGGTLNAYTAARPPGVAVLGAMERNYQPSVRDLDHSTLTEHGVTALLERLVGEMFRGRHPYCGPMIV